MPKTILPVLMLAGSIVLHSPLICAQHLPAQEKQKKIAFGEQFNTAWELYEYLVEEVDGGKPLTWQTVPDWSGVYRRSATRASGTNFDPDQRRGDRLPTAKLTPEGHAGLMRRLEMNAKEIQFDPISTCQSPGMPRWLSLPFLRDFSVTPKITYMNAEAYNSIRRIYTDGRGHLPEDEQYPVHNGDSIGVWDGDRLIIHTNQLMAHLYERNQPDYTEQTEVVEVWQKVDENTIEADVWVFDPAILAKPWYTRQGYSKLDDPDTIFRIRHWACKGNENNDIYMTEDGSSNFINFTFTDEDDPKGDKQ